jgi:transcriptional regulator GlxA family with amidase domain
MPISARVIIILFDGAQGLDIIGPGEAFAEANRLLGAKRYDIRYASTAGGLRATSSGAKLATRRLSTLRVGREDTVIVAGGGDGPVARAAADRALISWLRRALPVAHRVASVCTGAFILGTLGALDGKRCSTHWSACDQLAAAFPEVEVQREAIYTADGKIWTSAGITAGLDMTLAMIEQDCGSRLADAIAAEAVLYARRPGFQSQFSDALVAQVESSDPLGACIGWARRNLAGLSVDRMAKQAGLAVRTFHRRTRVVLGVTPAKLIERLRVEHARTLLSSTGLSQKLVAGQAGFSGNAQMQRALKRHLGVDGSAVRLLFRAGKPALAA